MRRLLVHGLVLITRRRWRILALLRRLRVRIPTVRRKWLAVSAVELSVRWRSVSYTHLTLPTKRLV